MLKKTALVLLSLNLLTSKPVTAEPITICVSIAAVFVAYVVGNENGKAEVRVEKAHVEAAKARVEAENVRNSNEIKTLQAQIRRKIGQAEEEYQQKCSTYNSSLWASEGAKVCAALESTRQLLQEQSRNLNVNG